MQIVLREEQLSCEDKEVIRKASYFPGLLSYFKNKAKEDYIIKEVKESLLPKIPYLSEAKTTKFISALVLNLISDLVHDFMRLFPVSLHNKTGNHYTLQAYNRMFGTISCDFEPLARPTKHFIDLNYFYNLKTVDSILYVLYGYAQGFIDYIADNNLTNDLVIFDNESRKYRRVVFDPVYLKGKSQAEIVKIYLDIIRNKDGLHSYLDLKYRYQFNLVDVITER